MKISELPVFYRGQWSSELWMNEMSSKLHCRPCSAQFFLISNCFSSSSSCRCICDRVRSPGLSSGRPGIWCQQGLRLSDVAAAQCWRSLTCRWLLCGKVRMDLLKSIPPKNVKKKIKNYQLKQFGGCRVSFFLKCWSWEIFMHVHLFWYEVNGLKNSIYPISNFLGGSALMTFTSDKLMLDRFELNEGETNVAVDQLSLLLLALNPAESHWGQAFPFLQC